MQIIQQSPTTNNVMMCFILCGNDGGVTVLDGGWRGDAEALLARLRTLCGPIPHVNSWILTHAHPDHIGAFTELCEHHAGAWTVDDVYWNFPTPQEVQSLEPEWASALMEFLAIEDRIPGRCHQLCVGDEPSPGLTVLQVYDPLDPTLKVPYDINNNSSAVLRLASDGVRVLFLADLSVQGGEKLLRAYGDSDLLRADVLQMAHHGQGAARQPVYQAIQPKLCIWPTPDWLWENNQDGKGRGTGPWETLTTREWMAQLGVQRHIIAKDGSHQLTLRQGEVLVEAL